MIKLIIHVAVAKTAHLDHVCLTYRPGRESKRPFWVLAATEYTISLLSFKYEISKRALKV